jgi:pimeloyl-ACP methyl ester carboxylesterase
LRSIEEWRLQKGVSDFYVLGHSLGGYLTAWYLWKYKPKVKGVFLMSPAGMNQMPEDELAEFLSGRSLVQKNLLKYVMYLLEVKHWSFNKLFLFISAKKIAQKYFSRPCFDISPEEMAILVKYPDSIIDLDPIGHKIIGFF